jgi:hypothetical protein
MSPICSLALITHHLLSTVTPTPIAQKTITLASQPPLPILINRTFKDSKTSQLDGPEWEVPIPKVARLPSTVLRPNASFLKIIILTRLPPTSEKAKFLIKHAKAKIKEIATMPK